MNFESIIGYRAIKLEVSRIFDQLIHKLFLILYGVRAIM